MAQCRAITAMVEVVAGEVGCVLHLAPATAMGRVATALAVCAQPRLLAGLDHGQLTVGQARASLAEIEHLDTGHARAGQVLTADRPVRAKTWQTGNRDRAQALRDVLLPMATSGGLLTDLTTDGHVPSDALRRLVDLPDVASTFPGDSTPT